MIAKTMAGWRCQYCGSWNEPENESCDDCPEWLGYDDSGNSDDSANDSPHEHVYGTWQQSHLAGTWHRACTVPGCKCISLDSDEDDSE